MHAEKPGQQLDTCIRSLEEIDDWCQIYNAGVNTGKKRKMIQFLEVRETMKDQEKIQKKQLIPDSRKSISGVEQGESYVLEAK